MNRNQTFASRVCQGVTLVLLLGITLSGLLSFRPGLGYAVTNSYGESIQLWGAGLYAYDSYFKAPIFIGSDAAVLALGAPLLLAGLLGKSAAPAPEQAIHRLALMSFLLYYAASLAFGVTYNALCLAYIALFGLTFFAVAIGLGRLYRLACTGRVACTYTVSRGTRVYLVLAGLSLLVAWLPDLLSSLAAGTSLDRIEVYTTEITYVLDMGILSPLLFLTLYLVGRGGFLGYVLLRVLLRVCVGIGILLPVQTLFQLLAGIHLPPAALVTKVGIFVALALVSLVLDRKLRRSARYTIS